MSMLKVIEVLAESDKSWEDAAQFAVNKANQSVRNVRSIWIENFEATVENGKIKKYRINGKISFVLELAATRDCFSPNRRGAWAISRTPHPAPARRLVSVADQAACGSIPNIIRVTLDAVEHV